MVIKEGDERTKYKIENVGWLQPGNAPQKVLLQADPLAKVQMLARKTHPENKTADDEKEPNAAVAVAHCRGKPCIPGLHRHGMAALHQQLRENVIQNDRTDSHKAQPIDFRNPGATGGDPSQMPSMPLGFCEGCLRIDARCWLGWHAEK
jgi:hypothetical protein